VANAVLGVTGVQYDIDKFIYLGTPTARSIIFYNQQKGRAAPAWRSCALRPVYGSDPNPWGIRFIVGRLFAYYLGLKEPRFVTDTPVRRSMSLS
jgi:hypothetical protein